MPSPLAPIDDQIEDYNTRHGHPYSRLQHRIEAQLTPGATVLDIGCGRTAPLLRRLVGKKAGALYGIDLVSFESSSPDLTLVNTDACDLSFLADDSVDLAYSRSVMEHVEHPDVALAEVHRVLKPGGRYIFLTPNKWDYASVISRLVPDSWHPKLVRWVSGRAERDVFPTFYRANSQGDVVRLAEAAGLTVSRFEFQGQYPAYLKFSRPLFWLGCRYETLLARVPGLSRFQGWIFCELSKP